MIRALVWKELREQWAVLVALMALGSGMLVGTATLVGPGEGGRATELRALLQAGRLGLVMLVMTAGVVVGGTLFAGEKEAGTFAFLDRLPAARWRVWLGKAAAGAGMVGVAVAVLVAVAVGVGLVDVDAGLTGWVLLALVIGYAAYGWGMLGSVMARTSLAACGLGLMFGTGAAGFLYAASAVGMAVLRREMAEDGYGPPGSEFRALEWAGLTTLWGLLALPMPIAAWLYTALDRSRRLAEADVRLPGVRGAVNRGLSILSSGHWAAGGRRLLWLAYRQYRLPALILGSVAAVAGGAMIAPEVMPLVVWPALTLALGVLVGVVGMTDEQASGAYRYWGERRLPAARLWAGKVGGGLALVLLLLITVLVPMAVGLAVRGGARGTLIGSLFRTGLLEPIDGAPVLTYLLVWPVYGFVFGHVAAVLFRKAVVAGAVGLLSAGALAALWLPSLLGGGLHGWQVWAPAVVGIATARALVWPWATDRVGTRAPLLRLAVGVAGVFLATAVGIGYRVVEVPAVAEVEEDRRFAEALPTRDETQAGRDLRSAAAKFGEIPSELQTRRADRPVGPRPGWGGLAPEHSERTLWVQATHVPRHGWPDDRPDLDAWLDQVFANGWDKPIFDAARKPTGVLEDPNELTVMSPLRRLDGVRGMAPLLMARGLQLQARGDPGAFVDLLDAWLAAVWTTRNQTVLVAVLNSWGMERVTYDGLDRWLERLDGRPDLLRRVLAALTAHDAADPFDPASVRLAEQVVVRNSVAAPSAWLPKYLDEIRPASREEPGYLRDASPAAELEANLVGFAWAVPWEQERLRRAVGLGNVPGREADVRRYLRGIPGPFGSMLLLERWPEERLTEDSLSVTTARRAAILKVAVRLVQAETGRPPATLAELAPRYLPALPKDPYSNQPFRYRVSRGETIEREPEAGPLGEPTGPPGVQPSLLNVAEFHAAAGLAGGVVCWPLRADWPDSGPEPVGPDGLPSGPAYPPIAVGSQAAVVSPFAVETVAVPAGQPILWSVGPDRIDNGGVRGVEPRSQYRLAMDGDLIFLVPLPPEAKQ